MSGGAWRKITSVELPGQEIDREHAAVLVAGQYDAHVVASVDDGVECLPEAGSAVDRDAERMRFGVPHSFDSFELVTPHPSQESLAVQHRHPVPFVLVHCPVGDGRI